MLPVMLAARKLDAEDKDIVMKLRYAYFALHALMIVCMGFIYAKAKRFSETSDGKKTVLIPPPPQVRFVVFADIMYVCVCLFFIKE